jgi:chromate transporter
LFPRLVSVTYVYIHLENSVHPYSTSQLKYLQLTNSFIAFVGGVLMQQKKKLMKLFTSTMLISAFTFGGGYVIVPLMKKRFVDELHWLEEEETLDFIAISQSSPGPIAVNASVLLGYRIAGIPGALTAILGTVLPPMLILAIISFFYLSFKECPAVGAVLSAMRAGVAAVIANVSSAWEDTAVEKKTFSVMIMASVFASVIWEM